MKRIRYRKHEDRPIYFSNQYLAGTKLLSATIINRSDQDVSSGYQVIINDLNKGELVYEQLCISFLSAKKVVKNKFIQLGVKVEDEVRKKIDVS